MAEIRRRNVAAVNNGVINMAATRRKHQQSIKWRKQASNENSAMAYNGVNNGEKLS